VTIVFYLLNLQLRIKVFTGYFLLLGIYLIYLFYGIGNAAFFHDLRLHAVFLILLIIFYNFFRTKQKEIVYDIIKALFFINIYISISYIFIKFNFVHNFYETETLAAYQNYRTIGPALFSVYLMPFMYLLYNIEYDRVFYFNIVVGSIAIFINGSLQNLLLFGFVYIIALFSFSKFVAFIRKSWLIIVFFTIGVVFLSSSIDSRYVDKIKELSNPFESGTIKTRISDLSYVFPEATSSIRKIILGSGVGVNSIVLRENKKYKSLTRYKTFLEIDNGFFYIFHRFGLIGLVLVLLIHFYLYLNISNRNAGLFFILYFIITNLLSYHYWVHAAAPFMIAAVLSKKTIK